MVYFPINYNTETRQQSRFTINSRPNGHSKHENVLNGYHLNYVLSQQNETSETREYGVI